MPSKELLSSRMLILVVCAAQFLGYLDSSFWPALLPKLSIAWSLNNREAGWITTAHYGAYLISAPILLSLTDRLSAKAIYLSGLIATMAGALCFAGIADGLWGAAGARVLSGIGEAGRFMVGVKLLSEHIEGQELSRGVAWNALTIGIATAVSYASIDPIAQIMGWRAAYVVAACAMSAASFIVLFLVPRPLSRRESAGSFDLWPVLKNRSAMAYVVAYSIHTFESVAFRGWVVAFLGFLATNTATGQTTPAPTVVAMVMVLAGTMASFLGNELALRIGRAVLVTAVLAASAALAIAVGFLAPTSYALAIRLVIVYGIFVYLDSAALTSGTSGFAERARTGMTLAVHSTLGYVGASIGPIAIGTVLDLCGGMSEKAWGVAFMLLAFTDVIGLVLFWIILPHVPRSANV
jgi:MFS family permease